MPSILNSVYCSAGSQDKGRQGRLNVITIAKTSKHKRQEMLCWKPLLEGIAQISLAQSGGLLGFTIQALHLLIRASCPPFQSCCALVSLLLHRIFLAGILLAAVHAMAENRDYLIRLKPA